jgi:hypothetical protein
MPVAFDDASARFNLINMNIRGDKVHLKALLDYNGVLDLERKLAAFKMLLPKPTPEDQTDAPKPNWDARCRRTNRPNPTSSRKPLASLSATTMTPRSRSALASW